MESSIGYLIVNVSTARGAIPLADASVTVLDEENGGGIMTVLTTDTAGKTERIALSAPDRSLSESPGGAKPYASYTLQVEKEDVARTGEAAPLPCAGYTNAFLQTPLRSIEQWGQYEEQVDSYLALLEQLNKILMQANAYVGYQIRNDIVTYLLNNHRCGFLPESEAIDHLITRKVLVRAQGNARTVVPVLEQLLRLCAGKYPQAEKKLLKMLEQCEKEDYTGYWI